MKNLIFIADYFIEDCFGGAEIVDKEIIEGLEENGYKVTKIRCAALTPQILGDIINNKLDVIISNFASINPQAMEFIATNCRYSIIEHDHKYVQSRDVTNFKDCLVPPNMLVNRKFYSNANRVFCQADSHAKLVSLNLGIETMNLSTSIWSDKDLDIMKEHCSKPKNGKTMVLGSNTPYKNTKLAQSVCEANDIDYDIVGPLPFPELMSKMAEYSEVLFLPAFQESFNRFIVEAKMLGCRVKTNNRNGATSEKWFRNLKGLELIDFIKDSKKDFISKLINPDQYTSDLHKTKTPLVSIITSKFKGDEHIEAFLENITSQSVFNSCELIIVDPTPGPPCEIILAQMRIHDNIIYKKIDDDPGIYGCWNIAIGLSHGKYITNANLDDRRADTHIAHHVRFLEHNEDIDLAYSEVFLTEKDFESYYANSAQGRVYPTMDFSNENMQRCLPGCMPVWRAKIHDNDVMFDASLKSAGDWEMWLKAVGSGSKFGKLPGIYGMYYMNPTGLSTNPETLKEKQIEEKSVFDKYKHIFTGA